MPADLRQHVRYPEDIFNIQSRVFATYHMTNPLVFYNKEDQWQVPTLEGERNATPMQPYYTVMRLPGEKQPEFIQMLPFTPRAQGQPLGLDGRAAATVRTTAGCWCSSSRNRRSCTAPSRSSA